MDERQTAISDHPALQTRWREPVLGWSMVIVTLGFLWCAAFGHRPLLPSESYDVFHRVIWLVLGVLLAWISYSILISNHRTRELHRRLVLCEETATRQAEE